jgi:hypothetical protein
MGSEKRKFELYNFFEKSALFLFLYLSLSLSFSMWQGCPDLNGALVQMLGCWNVLECGGQGFF